MAKKQKKARKPTQVWKVYESKGGSLSRKTSSCPKCGPGVFLAKHANRISCGKCGYTEMSAKK
ncbi:30S ribosomal protein S27ae [Candidatus Woesearchaeota archaeon]|nr:30S ribosomal protein S27ae [Candidatus Woesearchaeota archaeon]